MFAAIRAFFAVFITLFTALEKNASSILILSTIGEDMANTYADTSKAEREINQIKLKAKLAKSLVKAQEEAAAE